MKKSKILSKLFRNRYTRALLIFSITVCLFYLFHVEILNYIARQLVYRDNINPSDAIVVLAGDQTGERLMAGISLFKKGYGKIIVFWGGPIYWKITNAELFLRQMKECGIGPESAVWSEERLLQNSTLGEAQVNMSLLKGKGARSFILVTSNYHSARARYVYAPLAEKNGMKIYIWPSQTSDVNLERWWRDREMAKIVFIELQKAVWYRLFY